MASPICATASNKHASKGSQNKTAGKSLNPSTEAAWVGGNGKSPQKGGVAAGNCGKPKAQANTTNSQVLFEFGLLSFCFDTVVV